MPWAASSSLSDQQTLFGPKRNICNFFMILFGLFDLILLLSVKFVMWIVKQKIENKRNLFFFKNIISNFKFTVTDSVANYGKILLIEFNESKIF